MTLKKKNKAVYAKNGTPLNPAAVRQNKKNNRKSKKGNK